MNTYWAPEDGPRHSAAPVECEEAVITKIRLRRNAGRKKYGTTMERRDLDRLKWLGHAQEEAMDLAIYLEKLIRGEEPLNTSIIHRKAAHEELEKLMRSARPLY